MTINSYQQLVGIVGSSHKSKENLLGEKTPRPASDFYETPDVATRRLLDAETFADWVWEPACGRGAIAKHLHHDGHRLLATDLGNYAYGIAEIDFLRDETFKGMVPSPYAKSGPDIITNPPYSQADAFVRQALRLTRPWKAKVAMLLRVQWLAGSKRRDLTSGGPLARVYFFHGRLPMMHRPDWKEEHKQEKSMMDFAWCVWDWTHTGYPEIRWLTASTAGFKSPV